MALWAASGWLVAAAMLVLVLRLRARLELVARAEHELRGPLTAFSLALDAARGTSAGRRLRVVLEAELARARKGLADLSAARSGRRAEPVVERVRVDRLLRSSAAAWERGGRRVSVRSDAGLAVVAGDRGRLAQALGNVISNAVEHGTGDVTAVASRTRDRVRIEVTNATAPASAGDGEPDAPSGGGADAAAASDRETDRAADADTDGGGAAAVERGRGLDIAAEAAAELGGTLSSAIGPRRARTVIELPIEPS
jgi:signal transduction histidine kinase